MKTLSCWACGLNCGFVACGDTDEEVLADYRDHLESDHPEALDQMMAMLQDEEMAMSVRGKIKQPA